MTAMEILKNNEIDIKVESIQVSDTNVINKVLEKNETINDELRFMDEDELFDLILNEIRRRKMQVSDLIHMLNDITFVEVYSLEKEKTVYRGYSDELLYEIISDFEIVSIEVENYKIPKLIINIA